MYNTHRLYNKNSSIIVIMLDNITMIYTIDIKLRYSNSIRAV